MHSEVMQRNTQQEFERRMSICQQCPEFMRNPVPGVCTAESGPLQSWCKRKWELRDMKCPRGRFEQQA